MAQLEQKDNDFRKEGSVASISKQDEENTSKKINRVDFRISTAELDDDHRHKEEWDNVRKKGSSEEIIDYYHKYVEPELFSTVKPVKIFDIEVNDENRALLTTLRETYPSGFAPLPGQEHSWIRSNIKITEENYEKWRPLQDEFEQGTANTISNFVEIEKITSKNKTLQNEYDRLLEEEHSKFEEKQRREEENEKKGHRQESVTSSGLVTGLAGVASVASSLASQKGREFSSSGIDGGSLLHHLKNKFFFRGEVTNFL
jgi:hypothetical protein